ncbi:acyltransferase [Clostridiales bacterium]|nr:acyltransferase [Clostridiales bacterium]
MLNRKERIIWIDYLRVIAIILVVLCHSTEEGVYDLTLNSVMEMSYARRIFPFTCFTVGRLGVPIFLLISGYLLLDREYDTEAMKRFLKNKWLHLILCTIIWFLIYDLFLVFIQGEKLSVNDIIQDLLFLNKVQMSHVWYMPMIIGLYALIPFAANCLRKVDHEKIIWIPLGFFLISIFLYPTISALFRVINPALRSMSNQINAGFSGGTYGIYLVFGWLLKKETFKKVKKIWIVLLVMLSIGTVLWLQLWSYENNVRYSLWYDSPFLLVAAVCFFELFSRCKFHKGYRFLHWLSSYAFAVYLIHFPFKLLLLDFVMNMSYPKTIKVLIMWGLLLIISLPIAFIISLIPKCGNYLLYRKYNKQ